MTPPEVMFDIETLGTTPGCAVLSIGACTAETDFYVEIGIESLLLAGLRIEPATLEWWLRQPGSCRRDGTDHRLPLDEALTAFADFLPRDALLWCKGPAFDAAILEAAYRSVGILVPWSYRNLRDLRTALAMLPPVPDLPRNDRLHDALSDARHQWLHLQAARKAGDEACWVCREPTGNGGTGPICDACQEQRGET